MKNLLVLLFSFIILNIYSQNKNYDIYVELEKNSDFELIESSNDTLMVQMFNLKNQIHTVQKSYSINNGKLFTEIIINGKNTNNLISLIYENFKGQNNPFIKNRSEIKNSISYPRDFKNADIDNIQMILKNANQLFLIEYSDGFGNLFIKKVKFRPLESL